MVEVGRLTASPRSRRTLSNEQPHCAAEWTTTGRRFAVGAGLMEAREFVEGGGCLAIAACAAFRAIYRDKTAGCWLNVAAGCLLLIQSANGLKGKQQTVSQGL
jgi:hypothetical protein